MEDGINSALKELISVQYLTITTVGSNHNFNTGEKVYLISDNADYPENIITYCLLG